MLTSDNAPHVITIIKGEHPSKKCHYLTAIFFIVQFRVYQKHTRIICFRHGYLSIFLSSRLNVIPFLFCEVFNPQTLDLLVKNLIQSKNRLRWSKGRQLLKMQPLFRIHDLPLCQVSSSLLSQEWWMFSHVMFYVNWGWFFFAAAFLYLLLFFLVTRTFDLFCLFLRFEDPNGILTNVLLILIWC